MSGFGSTSFALCVFMTALKDVLLLMRKQLNYAFFFEIFVAIKKKKAPPISWNIIMHFFLLSTIFPSVVGWIVIELLIDKYITPICLGYCRT